MPLLRLLLLSLTCLLAFPSSACTLKVGWESWHPYIYAENNQLKGIEYQYLMAISDAINCRLEFVELPWIRALQELELGRIDLLYGASYSPQRHRFAHFSIPYRYEEMVLVTPARNTTINFPQWLLRNRIGLIRGFQYPVTIEKALGGVPLQQQTFVSSDDQLFMMLQAERIDGYLVERAVADWQLQSPLMTLSVNIIPGADQEPMYLMLNPRLKAEILTDINFAIEALDYYDLQ